MLRRKRLQILSGRGLFTIRDGESSSLKIEWINARDQDVEAIREKKGVLTTSPPILGRILHPANLESFEKIYLENAVVNAAINMLTEMTVGVGYFTETKDEKAKNIVDEYAEEVNLDGLLRIICRNCLIYGYAPVERWWDETLRLKPLPPPSIYVIIDAKGNLKGYQQKTWSNNYIDFKPDEIIWFSPFAYPGNPYGVGKIGPIYTLAQYRKEILQNFALIIKRHARPPAVWLTRGDPTTLQKAAEARSPDQDFFIGPVADPDKDLKIIIPDFDPRGKYSDLLEAINQEIYEGLQAPLLTWLKNSTEASAKIQLEAIQSYIAGVQRYFKRIIEREIFTPIIKKAGLTETPRLRWGIPPTGVEKLTIKDIAELVQASIITTKQGQALLRKIGLPIQE